MWYSIQHKLESKTANSKILGVEAKFGENGPYFLSYGHKYCLYVIFQASKSSEICQNVILINNLI